MVYLEEVTNINAHSKIVLSTIATVLLSALTHGIGANPDIKLYARTIVDLGPEAPGYAEVGANT